MQWWPGPLRSVKGTVALLALSRPSPGCQALPAEPASPSRPSYTKLPGWLTHTTQAATQSVRGHSPATQIHGCSRAVWDAWDALDPCTTTKNCGRLHTNYCTQVPGTRAGHGHHGLAGCSPAARTFVLDSDRRNGLPREWLTTARGPFCIFYAPGSTMSITFTTAPSVPGCATNCLFQHIWSRWQAVEGDGGRRVPTRNKHMGPPTRWRSTLSRRSTARAEMVPRRQSGGAIADCPALTGSTGSPG